MSDRALMKRSLAAIEALNLYGAAGIVSFGWALGWLLRFDVARYLPLWFAGALLVYNVDRLKHDPADAINVPARVKNSLGLRRVSIVLAGVSAGVLIVVPVMQRDWLLLALAMAGAIICLNYSVPVRGFRLKDVPLLKTFFAPVVLAAACLGLPLLQQGLRVSPAHFAAVAAWTFAFLFFNMTLCDWRDLEGDRAAGTRTVPVLLGRAHTLRLVWGLIGVVLWLGFVARNTAPTATFSHWSQLNIWTPAYLAVLSFFAQKDREEWFYSWCVEGMLFVPASVIGALRWLRA